MESWSFWPREGARIVGCGGRRKRTQNRLLFVGRIKYEGLTGGLAPFNELFAVRIRSQGTRTPVHQFTRSAGSQDSSWDKFKPQMAWRRVAASDCSSIRCRIAICANSRVSACPTSGCTALQSLSPPLHAGSCSTPGHSLSPQQCTARIKW